MVDSSKPIHLNYPNFEKVVGQSYILVDFWAEWCGPCKAQDPVLEELATETNENVLIGKVNIDDNRALASKYGINSIPTLILFKNSKEIKRFISAQSKERLMHYINKNEG